MTTVSPEQIEAARVGLKMTRAELGRAARVSEATILRMEKPKARTSLSANRDKVIKALEEKGIKFGDGGSVTVPTLGADT